MTVHAKKRHPEYIDINARYSNLIEMYGALIVAESIGMSKSNLQSCLSRRLLDTSKHIILENRLPIAEKKAPELYNQYIVQQREKVRDAALMHKKYKVAEKLGITPNSLYTLISDKELKLKDSTAMKLRAFDSML